MRRRRIIIVEKIIGKVIENANKNKTVNPQDYINPVDNLLYCGDCNTPKQVRVSFPMLANDIFNCICDCVKAKNDREEEKRKQEEYFDRIKRLKSFGLQDKDCYGHTFESDKGFCNQIEKAHSYANQWQEMYKENIGLLLWGDVGTGKSFFAGCIANALLEQCIPVCVTNFSKILNSLSGMYSTDKNEYLNELNRFKLLIIDDFGMERQTEYALEQVYSIIDNRYKNKQPLIITTNLSLKELKNPVDTAHARIYSRILEMCQPIRFIGNDIRKELADSKMATAKNLFAETTNRG